MMKRYGIGLIKNVLTHNCAGDNVWYYGHHFVLHSVHPNERGYIRQTLTSTTQKLLTKFPSDTVILVDWQTDHLGILFHLFKQHMAK